ncbi:hypothetical protein L1987_62426 [Smallanthus sonchifolius]|uniref:Uncharacterized protein n=1 Tax=Smallanthus sonchifolius TaxID=185202 RepID=A0ACB9CAC5_9ASTR|nr:hypothetical protein L1987_62426 [Smallanthus sonchifolius]
MASSLRLITKSFRPTLVSPSRFLSIAGHRSCSTIPIDADLKMPGLKKEDMRACAEHNLFIQGNFDGINLPDIKEEIMKDGLLKATDPLSYKDDIIAIEIISSFRHITAQHSWAYYDMFYDRSILGKGLCPIIAGLSSINSFSIYKKETRYGAENLPGISIKMSMPGLQNIKLTTQGLSVSLSMYGLKREDVKIFFDYDTFFIEGKTKKEHYITGIRLP